MALTDLGRVCPVARGEYAAATNYTRLDIVTFEGSSYICKANSTGNSPINTTYWQVLAQGALGEAGTPSKQNLLHNWDFRQPVNQRGASGAISTVGYFYDRWLLNSGAVTTNAAYLTIGAGAVIEQRIEGNLLAGAVVTVSVMVAGTVINNTGTMPISTSTSVTLAGWGTATLGYAAGYMYVRLSPTAASNVQAVKLELGTVSTLAYDPPMDYGTELSKCLRHCYVIREATAGVDLLHGVSEGANTGRFKVDFPVPMRIAPTFSASGSYMMGYQSGTGYTSAVSSVTQALSRFNFSIVNAQITTSILSDWRYTAVLFAYNSPCAITFSADL